MPEDQFKPGDRVMLSEDGKKDCVSLRNKRGRIIEKVMIGKSDLGIYRVEWGKKREVWHNHQSNLRLEK